MPTEPALAADWLAALAAACAESSQTAVARRLGVSPTVVNQTLHGKYTGDLDRVRSLVESVLMQDSVRCPVLGEISPAACRAHQRRPYTPFNSTLVALFRACRSGCPNSHLKRGE